MLAGGHLQERGRDDKVPGAVGPEAECHGFEHCEVREHEVVVGHRKWLAEYEIILLVMMTFLSKFFVNFFFFW